MKTTRTDDDFWLNEATIENDICDKNISTQSFLDIIIPKIEKYNPKKILDVGCGIGRLTEPISIYFNTARVFGTDINAKFLDYARERKKDSFYPYIRVYPIYTLADNLAEFENFDVIFSVLVFQHINNEAKTEYIRQASTALRQGGMLLFQYVEGDHSSRAMYDANILDVRKWCIEADLVVVTESFELLESRWTWVEAMKI